MAVRQFSRALELGPGRSWALAGLALAARQAGQNTLAVQTTAALRRNWHRADPGVLTTLSPQ